MTYDPKQRPAWLVPEHLRTSPDRLKNGVMSVADDKDNNIAPIPQPESALSKIMKGSKVVAVILVGIAGLALGMEAQGIVLPPAVKSIALVVLALGSALGLKGHLDRNGDGKIDEKDFEDLK